MGSGGLQISTEKTDEALQSVLQEADDTAEELIKKYASTASRQPSESAQRRKLAEDELAKRKLPAGVVYSTSKIASFSFKERSMHKILSYHEFYIRREDGTRLTFTEQDFHHFNPMDLRDIIGFLKTSKHKHASRIELKLCDSLRTLIMNHVSTDPYLAKELKIPIESSPMPNLELEGIDQIRQCTILEQPEFGIVYKASDNNKKFFRVSESLLYSDERLKGLIRYVSSYGIGNKKLLVDHIEWWMNSRVWARNTWELV